MLYVPLWLSAQKVGLVLSGGGAKGLAHIGVLMALEDNHIPIDYVVGTSMGGVVGGMYAAGYTPRQMQAIALSTNFQDWVSGRYDSNYRYFFQKKPLNPSFLSLSLEIDTGFQARFRAGLVNDIPLNFAFLELFTQASAQAKNNFDRLFVPYRSVVADVFSQKTLDLSGGSLAEAVRGTMTVPMVYRPVKVNGRYVFDGGLYDNFPVDIMKQDFAPDFIIGCNVSSKTFADYPKDDEKLMGKLWLYMFLSKSDSTSIGKSGIYIQPNLSAYSSTNFKPVAAMIKAGYDATMADMPRIKAAIARRADSTQLMQRRRTFKSLQNDIVFKNINVVGVGYQQQRYVEQIFHKWDTIPIRMADVRQSYYRLVTNDNFDNVYPRVIYHPESNSYDFEIDVKSSKNFKADIGGLVSTRPVSEAYLGLQYDYINRNAFTAGVNFYTGRFYESVQGTLRTDFPTRLPFYLETEFTYNYWDYINSNQISVEKISPTYVQQADRKLMLKAGIPVIHNGKIELQAGYINTNDDYSPNGTYINGDTLDHTSYTAFKTSIALTQNSLNQKQYPSKGNSYYIGLQFFSGHENYEQGSILRGAASITPTDDIEAHRQWFNAKISVENYITFTNRLSIGYLIEGQLSDKPLFKTYEASVLSSPGFYPLPDSRTLILSNFRAPTYLAGGLKGVVGIQKNLEWRTEGYVFEPLKSIRLIGLQDAGYTTTFGPYRLAGTTGLVYHSFVGPAALTFNYYDDPQKRFGVMFHIGFLLFNKRAIE